MISSRQNPITDLGKFKLSRRQKKRASDDTE
jgi:hypothetical protein